MSLYDIAIKDNNKILNQGFSIPAQIIRSNGNIQFNCFYLETDTEFNLDIGAIVIGYSCQISFTTTDINPLPIEKEKIVLKRPTENQETTFIVKIVLTDKSLGYTTIILTEEGKVIAPVNNIVYRAIGKN